MNYINVIKSGLFSVVVVIGILSFISCDKISKSDRNKIDISFIPSDTPSFPALDILFQKYLLEDFTGHRCANCPAAHVVANKLKAQMKDTLVLMVLHVGTLAKPLGALFSADFMTDAGTEYAREFGITSNPNGMINRMLFNGNRRVAYNEWEIKFNELVRKSADVGIQIIAKNDNENSTVFIKTSLLNDVAQNLQLCVLLTEDNIISPQELKNEIDTFYVHNHVLRTSITPDVWGDILDISKNGEFVIKAYSIDFKNNTAWRKENCNIVAFVYDKDTKEILQVEEIAINN